MHTKEIVNELENEINTLSESDSLESVKNHLIKSNILSAEQVEKLTKEQLEGFLNGIGEDQLNIQQKALEHKQYLHDVREQVISLEDNANIFTKKPGYIVLKGDIIPGTNIIAKRDYFRYNLGITVDMLASEKPVSFLYVGILTVGEKQGINHYGHYIKYNILPENSNTFMDEVIEHIMSINSQKHLILTQHGHPVMHNDINTLPSGVGDSFFFGFLTRMQRKDVSVFLQEEVKKK